MTLRDDTTWTKPWSAEMPLKLTDQMLYESGCHEGNGPLMESILSAARVREKSAAAARK